MGGLLQAERRRLGRGRPGQHRADPGGHRPHADPAAQRRPHRHGGRHPRPDVPRAADARRSATASRSGWPRSAPARGRRSACSRSTPTALRALLAGETVTTDGAYVHLDGVRLDWPPEPAPPLFVGGAGPKSVDLAARVGDAYLAPCAWTDAHVADVSAAVTAVRGIGHPFVYSEIVATGPGAQERLDADLPRWGGEPGQGIGTAGDADALVAAGPPARRPRRHAPRLPAHRRRARPRRAGRPRRRGAFRAARGVGVPGASFVATTLDAPGMRSTPTGGPLPELREGPRRGGRSGDLRAFRTHQEEERRPLRGPSTSSGSVLCAAKRA